MDIKVDAPTKQVRDIVQHDLEQQQRFLASIQAQAKTPFFNKNQQKFINKKTRNIISLGRNQNNINLPKREEILEYINKKLRDNWLNKVNQKVISWRMLKAIRSATSQF